MRKTKTKNSNIILLFILCTLFSCKNQQIEKELTLSDSLMTERPDSVLLLLENIHFPLKPDKEQYARYQVLLLKAKDKCSEDISEDTLITVAADYFLSKKDIYNSALAYFYAGRVFKARQQIKKAILFTVQAKDLSIQVKDNNLTGLIYSDLGVLYKQQLNYLQAIDAFQAAQKYFLLSGNEKNASYTNEQIGNIYMLKSPSQKDSAHFYYDKAIDYATSRKDTISYARILKNIGIHFEEAGDDEKAKSYLLKSIEINHGGKHVFNCYCSLSSIYLKSNQADSAIFYSNIMHKTVKESDFEKNYVYYLLLYEIYKKQGKYNLALENYEKCITYEEHIFENRENNSILKLQEKYKAEKLENANQELIIYRQYLFILIILIVIIGGSIVGLIILRMKKKEKNLLAMQVTVDTLNRMISYRDETNNKLKFYLLEKLDIIRQITQLNLFSSKGNKEFMNKYHQIVSQHIEHSRNWPYLYSVINSLYDGFVNQLNEKYSMLSEREKQLCCLIRAGFQADEIAIILSYKYESVSVMKYKLCKKMGISDGKDFLEFLSTIKIENL